MDADEIPDGWSVNRLADLCEIRLGKTPARGNRAYWEGDNPWAAISDLNDEVLTQTKEGITETAVRECGCKVVSTGTLLFSFKLTIGKMAFVGTPVFTNEAIAALPVKPGVKLEPRFLFYALKVVPLLEGVSDAAKGMTLNKQSLAEIQIPVPPLAEQRRIVARVEALTRRLDQARQARQAALAETESMLVVAISSQLDKRKAQSVPLGKILSAQPRNGWSPPDVFQTGHGIPVLTLSAVTGFAYDGSRVKFSSAPTRVGAHYWLEHGELLITRSNTPELVGHAAIYDGTPAKAICCDLIMKMKVDPSKADARFVHYCLRAPAARQFIIHRAKGTSGTMQKIAKQDVQEIPIPDISLAEQRAIVARLDALRGKLDELQRLQREVAAELASFTPALLAKAFRGKL